MGPYLALSRARPDHYQAFLVPVMDSIRDVLHADDEDSEVWDRANLLMHYLVLHQVDAGRLQRLKVCSHYSLPSKSFLQSGAVPSSTGVCSILLPSVPVW